MKQCLSFIILLFIHCNLVAASLVLDFSSRVDLDTASLVYNQALGVLHPTLQVMNFKGGFTPKRVDVGDGSHGSFDPSTYATFSLNGDVTGNRIQLDSTQYPILKVTNFVLAQGWTLEVVGNKPLIIYSLTDVSIAGNILCQGTDGSDAVGATSGSGGVGRCGGGAGGDGGGTSQDGANGVDTAISVVGGIAGNFTGGAAVAGGGGGSWNNSSPAGSGANVNVGGGQGGATDTDPEFLSIAGGAGGGGGSGTVADAGAGGGGGGGTVIIHAVRDFYLGETPASNYGVIRVNGGAGGNSNVPGGAGGGGAGGSVQVFVGRNIEIFNTDGAGASTANQGAGGSNSLVASGGNGGIGRNWFSSVGYNLLGTGFYTPAEQAPVSPGNIEFTSATQSSESISYDLANTKIIFNSLVASPVSTDFLLEVSGSDDDFVNDDTGWTSDLSLLTQKRYVKLKASISTSNVNAPDMLTSATINYQPGDERDFDFTAAGCGFIKAAPPKPKVFILFLFPLFCLLLLSSNVESKIDKQK